MTRYILFAIVSTLLVLLAWLLSPLLAGLSVLLDRNTIGWFGTVDDTMDGGQHQHPDRYPAGVTGWRLWWQRTGWICRNPAQGFQAYMLGYAATPFYLVTDEARGTMRTRLWRSAAGKRVFSYQWNIPIGGGRHIKMWFGWALKASINRFSLKFIPFGVSK